MDSELNWLNGLKAGDSAVIAMSDGSMSLATVQRFTATQIVVSNRKFRRSNGKLISSDTWRFTFLRQPTPARLVAIRRSNAISRLRRVAWTVVPDAVLFAVDDLMQAHSKSQLCAPEDGK